MHVHDANVVWSGSVCLSIRAELGVYQDPLRQQPPPKCTRQTITYTMAPDGKSSNVDENFERGSTLKATEKPAKTQNVKGGTQLDKKDMIKESQIKKEGKEKRITLTTGEAALGDVSTVEEEKEDQRTEYRSGIDAHGLDLTSHGPVFDDDDDNEDDEVQEAETDRSGIPFAIRRPNAPQPASRDYDLDGNEKSRPEAGKGFEEGGVPDEELEMEHPFNK